MALFEKKNAFQKFIDSITMAVYDNPELGPEFLDQLDAMSEQAFDDQCTGANPRYPLISEIKQMYLNAYYGKNSETV